MDKLAEFTENRPRLFGLAYRLLGQAAEAEDVLQDAYLRWEASGPVEVPAAWRHPALVALTPGGGPSRSRIDDAHTSRAISRVARPR
jgi:hypothetical protein